MAGQVAVPFGGLQSGFHRVPPVVKEPAPLIKLLHSQGQLPGGETEIGAGGQRDRRVEHLTFGGEPRHGRLVVGELFRRHARPQRPRCNRLAVRFQFYLGGIARMQVVMEEAGKGPVPVAFGVNSFR